ncbi:ABC transporter ATP-binding protein [Zongyangia hominis]|uniref:ABC transporter ATP-binding protein n=1 Tax=Zongyangia hominis TaxID=2763677 RepID=A0A926IAL4_9FIRM|nr:ABC transporter ATP-binding protein [Zongyangia hominis]MBC8569328.1 ABC transporter ATP-binding protein [Zongyangia hominis]
MKPIIEVKNLRKVYRIGTEKVVALQKIDLEIQKGEVCCILGTSGSGKSTLLNMLAGLEKPTRGQALLSGVDVTQLSERKLAKFRQRNVGFVFQSYNLMGGLTALENVAMPLTYQGVSRAKRNKRARAMLKAVGLGNRIYHKPTQMSGGQQQRVGIARAFVAKPKIVFADEPTGNLDTKTTMEVMELMVKMARKNNQTLVIVTHDPEISVFADRIVHITDGLIDSDKPNVSIVPPLAEGDDQAAKQGSESGLLQATADTEAIQAKENVQ